MNSSRPGSVAIQAAAGSGDGQKVLLVSPYNVEGRAWGGISFEFLQVVQQLEDAVLAAPQRHAYTAWPLRLLSDELVPVVDRVRDMVRFRLGLSAPRRSARTEVAGTFDLCFFACQFAKEIGEIDRIPDWRSRSGIACAFILEAWPQAAAVDRPNYRLLDRFDFVFVANPRSIPVIQARTSTPVMFLPTGADTLLLPPARFADPRVIDLLCVGRKNPAAHGALLDYAEQYRRLYLYDIWADMFVRDWAGARRYNAELAARARFFLIWKPVFTFGPGAPREQALSNRYFEGAASGSVMLGSRPDVEEFDALFDWPDAVIDLPPEPAAIAPFLRALEADPERLARARWRNRREALLRHDWAYRWAAVLDAIGFRRTARLEARLETLAARSRSEAAGFAEGAACEARDGWPKLGGRLASALLMSSGLLAEMDRALALL